MINDHPHQINMGVRGFRVDASKHMWPGDLEAIQGMTQVCHDDVMMMMMALMIMMMRINKFC